MTRSSIRLFVYSFMLLGFMIKVYGVSVSFTTSDVGFPPSDTPFRDSLSNLFEAGNRIVLGSFDTTGFATPADYFSVNGNNFSTLINDFASFSVDAPSQTYAGGQITLSGLDGGGLGDGVFSGSGSFFQESSNSIVGSALQDQKIYMWVFGTSDNSANLGANFSNVTEMGIFSSSDSHWNFGNSDLPTATIALRTSEIDEFFVGGDLNTSALIPEPSTYVLGVGLIALSVVIFRIQRNRNSDT